MEARLLLIIVPYATNTLQYLYSVAHEHKVHLMNYGPYLCILDSKSEEVDTLAGGIYLGLLDSFGLPKSGRCQDLPAILGGQEVSYAKENGCSVFKRSTLPLLLSCHSCVNG